MCVYTHTLANTQVYMGINIGWKVWLFICLFFFQSKFCFMTVRGMAGKHVCLGKSCGWLSLTLSSRGFLRQKERRQVGWRTPG